MLIQTSRRMNQDDAGKRQVLLWYLRDELPKDRPDVTAQWFQGFPDTPDQVLRAIDTLGDGELLRYARFFGCEARDPPEPLISFLEPSARYSWRPALIPCASIWVPQFGVNGVLRYFEKRPELRSVATLTRWLVANAPTELPPEGYAIISNYAPWSQRLNADQVVCAVIRKAVPDTPLEHWLVQGMHRAIQACHDGLETVKAWVAMPTTGGPEP